MLFPANMSQIYTDLASAAESGMDFSSRWLQDGRRLSSIRTTDILPVDLNAILCSNEATLAKLYSIVGGWVCMTGERELSCIV